MSIFACNRFESKQVFRSAPPALILTALALEALRFAGAHSLSRVWSATLLGSAAAIYLRKPSSPPAGDVLDMPIHDPLRDMSLLPGGWISPDPIDLRMGPLIASAQKLGLTIAPRVDFDLKAGTITPTTSIQIQDKALVAPVCNDGNNRSQITYSSLLERLEDAESVSERLADVQIMNPHGAVEGMDVPFRMPKEVRRKLGLGTATAKELEGYPRRISALKEPVLLAEEEFVDRVEKANHTPKRHSESLDPANDLSKVLTARKDRRDHFDNTYFKNIIVEAPNDGRQVVILAYNEAFHIVAARLIQCAQKWETSLEGIQIVPIMSDDPVVAGGDAPAKFANCVEQLIGW